MTAAYAATGVVPPVGVTARLRTGESVGDMGLERRQRIAPPHRGPLGDASAVAPRAV